MFRRAPETLPQLLEDLQILYRLDGVKMPNRDKLRECIEFLLRILHE